MWKIFRQNGCRRGQGKEEVYSATDSETRCADILLREECVATIIGWI